MLNRIKKIQQRGKHAKATGSDHCYKLFVYFAMNRFISWIWTYVQPQANIKGPSSQAPTSEIG